MKPKNDIEAILPVPVPAERSVDGIDVAPHGITVGEVYSDFIEHCMKPFGYTIPFMAKEAGLDKNRLKLILSCRRIPTSQEHQAILDANARLTAQREAARQAKHSI